MHGTHPRRRSTQGRQPQGHHGLQGCQGCRGHQAVTYVGRSMRCGSALEWRGLDSVLNIPFTVMAPRRMQEDAHPSPSTLRAAALVWHEAATGSHFDLFLESNSACAEPDDRRLALGWRLATDPRVNLEEAIQSSQPLPAHRLAWARMRRQDTRATSAGEHCTCVASGVVDWANDSGACGACAWVELGGIRLRWPCASPGESACESPGESPCESAEIDP